LGDNDRKRGNALEGEHQGNDNGLDDQSRATPSRSQSYSYRFEVGVTCAVVAAIMGLARKTPAQGHHVAAAARPFWPRWSSSNRCLPNQRVVANVLAALAGHFSGGFSCLSLLFTLLFLLFLCVAVDHNRSDGKPCLCRTRRHQLQIMLLDNRRGISRLVGHLGHVFVDGNERGNASVS
jgi:hypothetical protein